MAEAEIVLTQQKTRAPSGNLQGAIWVALSSLTFVVATVLIKLLSSHYSAGAQAFYRQLAGVIVLLPVIIRQFRRLVSAHRLPLLLFRSAVQSAGFILSFWSYELLPLADANALSFTRALWIVPLAVLFLRERVSVLQVVAAVLGFCGVMIMLRPGEMAASLGQGVAVAAALMIAFANISVKSLSRDHDTTLLVVWSSVLGTLLTAPFIMIAPRLPDVKDLGMLSLMGALGVLAQIFFIKGIRLGSAATVGTVDYSRLIFAAFFGWLFFNEHFGGRSLAGALVIVAAGFVLAAPELMSLRKRSRSNLAN